MLALAEALIFTGIRTWQAHVLGIVFTCFRASLVKQTEIKKRLAVRPTLKEI